MNNNLYSVTVRYNTTGETITYAVVDTSEYHAYETLKASDKCPARIRSAKITNIQPNRSGKLRMELDNCKEVITVRKLKQRVIRIAETRLIDPPQTDDSIANEQDVLNEPVKVDDYDLLYQYASTARKKLIDIGFKPDNAVSSDAYFLASWGGTVMFEPSEQITRGVPTITKLTYVDEELKLNHSCVMSFDGEGLWVDLKYNEGRSILTMSIHVQTKSYSFQGSVDDITRGLPYSSTIMDKGKKLEKFITQYQEAISPDLLGYEHII